jgi:DNA replication protein DnaC
MRRHDFEAAVERIEAALESPDGQAAAALEAERAESQRQHAARSRVLDLGLPITAADEALLVLDQLSDSIGASLPAVREWLADGRRRPWLWLCGPMGRGKTLAACWALMQRSTGRLVGARELERLHMTRFGDETVAAYELLCRARMLVVVDDLGREDTAAKMQSALLDLVDQRRGTGHLTIVTTNLKRDDLVKRYADPRLWSRAEECSQWLDDRGPDLRARKP